jgi:hypothetical protein
MQTRKAIKDTMTGSIPRTPHRNWIIGDDALPFFDVRAYAECMVACSGDNHRAHVAIIFQLRHRRFDLLEHRERNRVQLVRAIECESGDGILEFKENMGITHLVYLCKHGDGGRTSAIIGFRPRSSVDL